MEPFFTAISNFGFPIVVAGYLLFRFENKIDKLDKSICGDTGLIVQVGKLTASVNKLSKELKSTNGKKR